MTERARKALLEEAGELCPSVPRDILAAHQRRGSKLGGPIAVFAMKREEAHGDGLEITMGNGPWDYSQVSLLGSGNTRDIAAYEALKNCNAAAAMDKNLAWTRGAAVDGGECKVTQCMPPGS